jgi:hypothetical protein
MINVRHINGINVDLESEMKIENEMIEYFISKIRAMLTELPGEKSRKTILAEWKQFLKENQLH